MPIGENIISTQLYNHRAIFHMMSVAEKANAELEKMLTCKDKMNAIYEKVEAEKVTFVEKEKNYKDCLNIMGDELNASLTKEHKLMDEVQALRSWGEKASARVESEKERADIATARATAAVKRVKEAELRAIKEVEEWRASPEFDALAQDAYVLVLGEIYKYINKERLDWDTGFMAEAYKELKEELKQLSIATGVRITPAEKYAVHEYVPPQDPPIQDSPAQ